MPASDPPSAASPVVSGTLDSLHIRSLARAEDSRAFRTLNEEWITRSFTLEAKDRETLGDPEGAILAKGGRVYLADLGGCTVGCVALIPIGGGVYELSKMAVAPEMRGRGVGRQLLEHAIREARRIGAASLFLGSSTKLPTAVRLYESVGFRHVPPARLPPLAYARADVFMEMPLLSDGLVSGGRAAFYYGGMPDLADARSALLEILATQSFRLGDFTLASGQKSDYYIDCRTSTLHAEGGRLAGVLLHELIRQHMPEAEAVGGLTMGADPLVSNIATASAQFAAGEGLNPSDPGIHLVHGFLVRKAEKTHGTGRRIEGFLKAGAPVVIVDDVCTTGGSTITAIEAAREAGMRVVGVLCLVDRLHGGRARIEAAAEDAPFFSLFTADDVRKVHIELHSDDTPA